MKTCLECKHAKWKRTPAGRLHPSGDGQCTYLWIALQLPQSMYWIGRSAPKPAGSFINRRHALDDHCAYWAKESAK